MFPQMHSLGDLDVSDCRAISARMWHALLPALTVLHAHGTSILANDAGDNTCHKSPRELRELRLQNPRHRSLANWTSLGYDFGRLRVLDRGKSFELGDAFVSEALHGMPLLEELSLGSCRLVGSRTFDALSTLPALTKLDLSGTSFSDADAARTIPQLRTLRHLEVSFCGAVGAGLWETLPPALSVLRANKTRILDIEVDNRNIPNWTWSLLEKRR